MVVVQHCCWTVCAVPYAAYSVAIAVVATSPMTCAFGTPVLYTGSRQTDSILSLGEQPTTTNWLLMHCQHCGNYSMHLENSFQPLSAYALLIPCPHKQHHVHSDVPTLLIGSISVSDSSELLGW